MTTPEPIKPTVTKDEGTMGGTIKTHPAYGMLSINRVSGSPGVLFGSEIKNHFGFIRMTLLTGEDHRSLSRNWYHGRLNPCLMEVDMSHSQFAEMITTLNVGSGVPVTIRCLNHETLPRIVDEDTVHDQIKAELNEDAAELVETANKLTKQLADTLAKSGLSKVKQKELTDLVSQMTAKLTSSMPFVLDSYQEAIETMKQKAATEVDAACTSAINRLGLKSIEELNALGGGDKQKALS